MSDTPDNATDIMAALERSLVNARGKRKAAPAVEPCDCKPNMSGYVIHDHPIVDGCTHKGPCTDRCEPERPTCRKCGGEMVAMPDLYCPACSSAVEPEPRADISTSTPNDHDELISAHEPEQRRSTYRDTERDQTTNPMPAYALMSDERGFAYGQGVEDERARIERIIEDYFNLSSRHSEALIRKIRGGDDA